MTYTVTVDGAIARINWWFSDFLATYDDYLKQYGDGMVSRTPFGYNPNTDPPPSRVYVTDLPHSEPWNPALPLVSSYAYEFLGIVDYGDYNDFWEGEGLPAANWGARLTPLGYSSEMGDQQEISLTAPSVITSHHRARWKFRTPLVIDRPLQYQNVIRRRHRWTLEFFLGYSYYLRQVDIDAGWSGNISSSINEYVEFGGWMGGNEWGDQWLIRYLGDGQAQFIVYEAERGDGGST